MIRLVIVLDENGCFRKLKASGHAEHGKKGRDIVCSAVSAVVRTACRLAEDAEGVQSTGTAGSEGSVELDIRHIPPSRTEWFRGVTDFLVCALSDIGSEYPERIVLDIRTDQYKREET